MSKPLLFYTSRVDYDGEDRLDISRETGCRLGIHFAPSWSILKPALALRDAGRETEESWQQYAAAYRSEMRALYAQQRDVWQKLLARRRAVLCCYCNLAAHPGRCHRLLLAEYLKKLGAVYLGELAERTAHWLDLGPAEGSAG